MINLDYTLSEAWQSNRVRSDLQNVDGTGLRYREFLGDITFRIGDADFSAAWGWIPIFDFAASLQVILGQLSSVPEAVFDFTESDAKIFFKRRNGSVEITCSYCPDRALITLIELTKATDLFIERLHQTAITLFPDLKMNANFQALFPSR